MIVGYRHRDVNSAQQCEHKALQTRYEQPKEQEHRWEDQFGQAGEYREDQVITKDVSVKTKRERDRTNQHPDDLDTKDEGGHDKERAGEHL